MAIPNYTPTPGIRGKKNCKFIGYNATGGTYRYLPDDDQIPELLRNSLRDCGNDEEEFGRLMANDGAQCIEDYGDFNERIEVWRMGMKAGGGWYIFHDDGDAVDAHFFIGDTIDYMAFQADWLWGVAQKIMASDVHYRWARERAREAA